MSYYLFLDDERFPKDVYWIELPSVQWVIVRNMDEFKNVILERGLPAHISFDNDLGEDQPEGRDCAKWLVDHILDLDIMPEFTFTVHSMNPVAAEAINNYLTRFFEWMKTRN